MGPNSNKPEIAETGLRGFLKWLQREQPEVYKLVAPKIAQTAPTGFSDYRSSKITAMRTRAGALSQRRFGSLGDDPTGLVDIQFDANSLSTPDLPIDTADAANTGPSSTGIMDTIGSIVNGVFQAGLAFNSLQTAKQVTNLQLQRAQAGLPPLNIDMSRLGVPSVSVGLTSGTSQLVMYGVGALLVVMLIGGLSKSRGR